MSKFRIINLIDKLFITFATFLIIYAWINFYIRDLWTTFILSIVFTFACVYLLYFILNKQQEKKDLTAKNIKEVNEYFLCFRLSSKQKKLQLLNEILSVDHLTILKKNSLVFVRDNKKILVIIASYIDTLTQKDLITLIEQNFTQEVDGFEIICNEKSPNLKTNLYTNKVINVVTKNNLYTEYFKKYNLYPDKSEINLKSTKVSLLDILKGFFVPKKAKAYFVYGLLLIFSSLILPFQAYYIVIGSMLLLFSIICKILPKFTNC